MSHLLVALHVGNTLHLSNGPLVWVYQLFLTVVPLGQKHFSDLVQEYTIILSTKYFFRCLDLKDCKITSFTKELKGSKNSKMFCQSHDG